LSKKIKDIIINNNTVDKGDNVDNWKFILIDGFLLYWEKEIFKEIDLKFFIQADYEILKERRNSRSKYITLEGGKKNYLFT
jgi:uridine kinase